MYVETYCANPFVATGIIAKDVPTTELLQCYVILQYCLEEFLHKTSPNVIRRLVKVETSNLHS